MAEYIMAILRSQLTVLFSWGFNSPMELPNNNGLRFNVNGFKYQGSVDITYNEGSDLFNVSLNDGTKVEDVYVDSLINVIDGLIEKTENYQERIKQEYNIHYCEE